MLIAVGLLTVLALTAATGYFVAQEFAYVAVDRSQLRKLAAEGDKPAERALQVTSQLSFTLSGAQFGITLTALLVGYVSEPYLGRGLAELLEQTSLATGARVSLGLAVALLFSTVVQMVLGELGPKNLAIARTLTLARGLSRSTLLYLRVAGPVVRLFDRASNRLLRAIGIEPLDELPQGATPEDLHRIIAESHTGGLLDDDLSRLLDRGLAFRTHVAEEVMTPRIDVQIVHADEPASRVVELLELGHSRFPVTGRDIDDVVGVIGIAELLPVPVEDRGSTAVKDLASEPLRLPASLPLPRVLEQLRRNHRQLAVVVDEYGGFAGVISFEDVAEEVVGEIWDEDDTQEPPAVHQPDGSWVVPARLRLDEVAQHTGIELPEDEEYDTVSGLVLDRLGRTAHVGDEVDLLWEVKDEHGDAQVARARLHVLSVQRHVPETVALAAPVLQPGTLDQHRAGNNGQPSRSVPADGRDLPGARQHTGGQVQQ